VTDGASPVVRQRRLAVELRRLRLAAGKTLDDAAEYLECSPTKVSRIESGHVRARIQDVREMLDCYGLVGADREALLDLVRQARRKGWWHAYADMIPEAFQTMIGLEDEATAIWTYENHLIPGLLQTEGYARALMASRPGTPADLVERGLQLRTARQAVLSREHGPQLSAVIDEAALRRTAGGPEVMDEQYAHLIAMAASPAVTVQVLPFEAGADAGGSFPFVILGFADHTEPKVVYAELLTAAYFINTADDVRRYLAQFDNLRDRALDPADSLTLIRRLRQQSRSGHSDAPSRR
jgi:transcriptional regulator with XRE-family HTH domain